jgi:hypothetical protein
MYVKFLYVFQLKQFQQKGKDGQPTGIKISGKKIAPKTQLVEDGNSLEQNLVFVSGPMNSECSKVHSTISVVNMFNCIYLWVPRWYNFFIVFHYRLALEQVLIVNYRLSLNLHYKYKET